MSPNRRYSYHLRADSPPLIERIPTPPDHFRPHTSRYRPDSPPLVTRIPTPPLTARSFSPTNRTVRTYRTEPSVSSRLYNLFHSRPRRVEVVETPVRRRRTISVHQTPSSHPASAGGRHRLSQNPASPPRTPTATRPPRRGYRVGGMSPQIPDDDYVPLPDALPRGEPTPPASKERSSRHSGPSPRRPAEYFADPWTPREKVVDSEESPVVTENRPIRTRPDSREATLIRENQSYRDTIKRLSQELEQKDHNIENYKTRQAGLQDQLAEARDRAQRDKRGSNNELDEIRFRLQQCLLERDEQQRRLEDRERELDMIRREQQRPAVILYDDDDRRSRPTRQTNLSSGMAAIREAQNDQGRPRDRRAP